MPSKRKWIVLGVYSVSAALSQLLWLNFAPVLSFIQNKYSVDESTASLLILVFPLIYVLLSIPTGAYIDKHGYRRGIGIGAVIMAAFACLRIYDSSFAIMLVAQTGIAIAQPFIINGISKLVLDWFSKEQSAIATGLGTMGMFIGMAVGMAATPPLIENYGLSGAMMVFAIISVLSALAFFLFVKPNPAGQQTHVTEQAVSFLSLLKDLSLLKLFFISFLGLGFFNGLTTWLELILAPHGINSAQAGIAGGVLILGGIVGAGVIPALSDHFKKRKPFLVASIFVATLTLYPLCWGRSYSEVLIFSVLQGFFFLPAFSLLLEMCADLVGEARAASATSILMLMGNAGGVVVVIAMEAVKGQDFSGGVHLMFATLVISFLASLTLPETRK
jgi:cyanate permease